MPTPTLQSLIADRWVGAEPAAALRSAIDGHAGAHTHAEALDFAEAVDHAHRVGVPALLRMDFQQRAARLKALAAWLLERKEALYALSHHTGATRADSWIDIEGGAGTLFAYASVGAADLPSGNVVHEGPAVPLGKTGVFAGTHILVPRRGVAVHINAFNFPIWGLLEKFAPSFLAGMPCIGKPATATSYLTEAMVRHAVRAEFAMTVEDVLARRWRALFLDARAAARMAPEVARILTEEGCPAPALPDFLTLCQRYLPEGGEAAEPLS